MKRNHGKDGKSDWYSHRLADGTALRSVAGNHTHGGALVPLSFVTLPGKTPGIS